MPPGANVGSAWYDLDADDPKLRAKLAQAESLIRQSGDRAPDMPIDGDIDPLKRDLTDAERAAQASGKKSADGYANAWEQGGNRVRQTFGRVNQALAAIGVGIGLATVLNFFSGAIGAASDLNETTSKTQVVFGDAAAAVFDMGKTSATALGMSENAALSAAGTYGNLFRAMGITEEKSAEMSIGLVKLAADLASFNNMDPTEVLDKLRAGLSGETEPLRTLGVNLNAARIEAKAFEMGLADATGALSPAAKAQATYALILEDTTLAQGDFARTSSGLANTQRTNAAIWENTLARIGKALLPLAQSLADFAGDVLPGVGDAILDVIGAVQTMAAPLLALARLWAEHASQIIPAVAIAYGVRLVASLEGATLKTKALDLAAKSLRATLLLGIPLLLEGGEAIHNWALEAQMGADDAALFKNALATMDRGFWEPEINGMKEMQDAAAELGMSWQELAAIVIAENGATGASFDEQLVKLRAWHDGSAAELQETNRDYATILEAGRSGVAQGAERLFAPLSEEQQKALDLALTTTRDVPGGLAAVLEDGREVFARGPEALRALLVGAIQGGADDAEAIAAQLPTDIAAAIIGTPVDLEEIERKINEIMVDPITSAAALAGNAALLVNPNVVAGLRFNNPELQAAMLGQVDELMGSMNLLNPAALTSGEGIPKNLRAGVDATKQEAISALETLRLQMAPELDLETFARTQGFDNIAAFIAGTASQEENARRVAAAVASRAANEMGTAAPAAQTQGRGVASLFGVGVDAGGPYLIQRGRNAGASVVGGMNQGGAGARQGGMSIGGEWVIGIEGAMYANAWRVIDALGYFRSILGNSLPTAGPLRGDLVEHGGTDIGATWTGRVAEAIDPRRVVARLDSVRRALTAPIEAVLSPVAAPLALAAIGGAAGGFPRGMTAGGAGMTVNGPLVQVDLPDGWQGTDGDVRELSRRLATEIRLRMPGD